MRMRPERMSYGYGVLVEDARGGGASTAGVLTSVVVVAAAELNRADAAL